VDNEIQRFPACPDLVERRIQRRHVGNIAIDQEIAAKLGSKRPDPFCQCLSLIGKGQFGSGTGKLLGNAPGKGFVIGKPHDQAALALH